MQYYQDFLDKYGFSDGNSVPAGIETYREVYIKTINTIAARRGSDYRVIAINSGGAHNPFFMVFYKLEDLQSVGYPEELFHKDEEELGPQWPVGDTGVQDPQVRDYETDIAMQSAIDEAQDMNLDWVIVNTIDISPGFYHLLQKVSVNEFSHSGNISGGENA